MEDPSITTAALVGVVMALIKVVEKGLQKANGGSVEYRLQCLEKATEKRMDALTTKLQDFSRAFFEFREEQRIHNVLQRQQKEDD
jgi:hypothetical protein